MDTVRHENRIEKDKNCDWVKQIKGIIGNNKTKSLGDDTHMFVGDGVTSSCLQGGCGM